MCFRCFKHVSLHVYYWVWSWKNFENRSTFGEVMGKSSVRFLTHGTLNEKQKSHRTSYFTHLSRSPQRIYFTTSEMLGIIIAGIINRVTFWRLIEGYLFYSAGGGVRIRQLPLTWSGAVNTVLGFGTAADNRKLTCNTDSPSTCPPVSPSVTHSLFHSRLKTNLFHKSFPPQSVSTHRTAFSDDTGPDSFCSTVFIFIYLFIFITGYVVD